MRPKRHSNAIYAPSAPIHADTDSECHNAEGSAIVCLVASVEWLQATEVKLAAIYHGSFHAPPQFLILKCEI